MVTAEKQKEPDGVSFTTNTSGDTWCHLIYKGQEFIGHTRCLPQDEDFQSENVGCFIAETRAIIKQLKYAKKQLMPGLKALEDFEKTLKCCKNHDSDSFEARRLRKEIYLQKRKIDEINSAIKDEQDYLTQYIKGKDKLYNRLRSKQTN